MNQYRKATNHACDMIEPNVDTNGNFIFPESTFADSIFEYTEHVRALRSKSPIALNGETRNHELYNYDIKQDVGYYLAALALTEIEFFDYCTMVCAANIFARATLPRPLEEFASHVLSGRIKRPKKRSRPRKKDFLQKSFLWSVTLDLIETFHLKMTRNDDGSAKVSACDAVAEAATVCGRKTTYTEIKNLMVHPDNARLRREFEASKRIYARWSDAKPPQNFLNPETHIFWANAAKQDVLDILATFPPRGKKSH